jgi:iron complex outermembrane recepter protein
MKTKLLSISSVLAFVTILPAQSDESIIDLDAVRVLFRDTSIANNALPTPLLDMQAPSVSVTGMINSLPGVSVQEGDSYGGDDWSTSIFIRGFKTSRSTNQLGYTVDGFPNGNTNYGGGSKPNRFIDPENVQSVLVSQGTAGIDSAAAQALGGTIEYSSVNPTDDSGLFTTYSTGSFNMRRAFARYNTGTFAGNQKMYVSLSEQFHNRWTVDGNNGVAERFHGEIKHLFEQDKLKITTRFSFDDIHEDNYNGVTLTQFAENPEWDRLTGTWSGKPAIDEWYVQGWSTLRENTLLGMRLDYQVSQDLRFFVQPYYHYQKGRGDWLPPYQRRGFLANGSPVSQAPRAAWQSRVFFTDAAGNDYLVGSAASAPAGLTVYAPSNPFDINTYGLDASEAATAIPVMSYRTSRYQNNRYGTRAGATYVLGDHQIEGGIWYEHQQRRNWRTWQKVLDARAGMAFDHRGYWLDYDTYLNTNLAMIYVSDTFTIGGLKANVGLRKLLIDLDYEDRLNIDADRSLNSDSPLLFSAGASYNLTDNHEVFTNFAQNFSGINDNIVQSSSVSGSLEPEEATNFDVGYRFTNDRLTFSVTGYMIGFDNLISFVTPRVVDGVTEINYDIGQAGGYVNVGGYDTLGLELAMFYRITDTLNFFASGSHNSSEYSRSVPENGVVKGNKVVGSPEQMLTVSLNYDSSRFQAGITAKHTGKRYGTLDNSEELDSNLLVDVSIGAKRQFADSSFIKLVRADLRVSNLFNTTYLAGLDGEGSRSTGYYFIGAPRAMSVTFSAEF